MAYRSSLFGSHHHHLSAELFCHPKLKLSAHQPSFSPPSCLLFPYSRLPICWGYSLFIAFLCRSFYILANLTHQINFSLISESYEKNLVGLVFEDFPTQWHSVSHIQVFFYLWAKLCAFFMYIIHFTRVFKCLFGMYFNRWPYVVF